MAYNLAAGCRSLRGTSQRPARKPSFQPEAFGWTGSANRPRIREANAISKRSADRLGIAAEQDDGSIVQTLLLLEHMDANPSRSPDREDYMI